MDIVKYATLMQLSRNTQSVCISIKICKNTQKTKKLTIVSTHHETSTLLIKIISAELQWNMHLRINPGPNYDVHYWTRVLTIAMSWLLKNGLVILKTIVATVPTSKICTCFNRIGKASFKQKQKTCTLFLCELIFFFFYRFRNNKNNVFFRI